MVRGIGSESIFRVAGDETRDLVAGRDTDKDCRIQSSRQRAVFLRPNENSVRSFDVEISGAAGYSQLCPIGSGHRSMQEFASDCLDRTEVPLVTQGD